MTLTFDLGGHGACRWCGSTSSICTPTVKFLGLTVRKIWHILCACVSRPVNLTFDLETDAQCGTCHGVPPANFGDTMTIRFRFMGNWGNTVHIITWPCDLDLWPCGRWRLWLMRVVVLHSSIHIPCLKFVGLAIRNIWRTMCVSINAPDDLDLSPFDLETGTRVASKAGNLRSKFGHARLLGSRIVRYVRNGRTDRQKQRTYRGWGIII